MNFFLAINLFEDEATGWIAMTFGALVLMYVFFRPSLRRKKDPLARSPAQSSLSQQRSAERQMTDLLVQLSEMARQITAQLDTRAAKLEALIQEADERLAALSDAATREKDPYAAPRPPGKATVEAPPVAREADPRHAQVYELSDQGLTPREISRQVNRPTGEIELILALRPRVNSGEGLSDT